MYSETVMSHFQNPQNTGAIEDADGVGEVGNTACGDILKIFINVENSFIKEVKFQTFGCGAAVASGSMTTVLAQGKHITEAKNISNQTVAEALGGLPPQKLHCSNLAADALQKAIADWESKNKQK